MPGIANVVLNSDIFTQGIQNNPIKKENIASDETSKLKFSDVMNDAISKVNESQVSADKKIESLIKGEDVSMHGVMLSVQESQMSMQLMLEVRNKLFEAYQEVNRVQL